MQEVLVKTHLIVTEMHEEYSINWCGKIKDTRPLFENNKPVFAIVGSKGRIELNTTDMKRIENCAKQLTNPHGRQAITSDTSRIYIKEEDGKETLLGIVRHDHIKKYAPMFDPVGYK